MLKNMTLQNRLIGSFMFMGSIVLGVALVGWSGSAQLSQHIHVLGKNSVPSIRGLWKINEGQTQIQSSERAVTNPIVSQNNKSLELTRVSRAWQQIDEGFREYETTPQTQEESELYKSFQSDWEKWKQNHKEFLRLYQTAQVGGLSAKELSTLNNFLDSQVRVSFDVAEAKLLQLLEINSDVAANAQTLAVQDVSRIAFWVIFGMIVGPTTAIIFGIYFSRTIAKPLGAKIASIVNAIVSSSTEIAATIEQQERIASEQAVSVNQTTTTMDELSASSRQSADQAETAANGAKQVLTLVDRQNLQAGYMTSNGSSLREKVEQITDQILHLSEQTGQIGIISMLVSDLANQTNMLALNAAVEAVRAGEHGKGFGVVAAEIRKLADQSKKSAERINALVVDIKNATNSTVMVTDEGSKTVETIIAAVNDIALTSQQISLTAKQQAIAIQQVGDAMSTLNQNALQTASGITQTKVGTQKLNEAALNLKAIV
ncbi:MCP four helix bundle domain-containing protein [Phormidium sp. FACHB-592]|nr:methyl-accepting chemotaxis protein [Phormidium sp. FACHB-592]MBD2073571.1 MCP four helix bundle domain-containing protein [Phormidium sp. FACHB-592]